MAGTSIRRAGRAPVGAAAAFVSGLLAAVLLASLAPVDVALAADAGDAGVDMYGRPSLRKALTEVHRERANRFLAAALGSMVGLVGAGVLLSIWRRSPPAARVAATAALAVVTARFLGLYLIHERLNAPPVGALATWFFLAIVIPLVYRGRIAVTARRSLPWLRVRARPTSRKAAETDRPTRAAPDAAEVAEAERVLSEALAALDRGDVAAAEAALRLSIEARPTKRARTYLGTLLGARGEGEAALAELDRALALDPSYTEALDERARVLRSLGREEEAETARRALREARAGGPKRADAPTACPACEKEVEPGAARCECGTALDKCSQCGRGDVPLRAHEGEFVCGRCRTREAAGHSKGPRRVEEALAEGGPPPWLAAASFAGAVVVGAALSFVYVGWREFRAARELGAIVRDAEAALSSAPGEGARPQALELRRQVVSGRDGFVRDRAATLKIALAVHGLARAGELAADEPELARVAREWAARRLTEARNSLEAGDREKLEEGFDKAYRSVVGSLDRLLERRRWLAADLARKAAAQAAPPAVPPDEVDRDWREVWRRPGTGTRFMVECFRRASDDDKAEVVGKHRDGSRLVAHAFYLCSVVEPWTRGG
ncbi:MAG: tetratricopeptide repeat protein, partial [Planctomycetota bacterium]